MGTTNLLGEEGPNTKNAIFSKGYTYEVKKSGTT